MRARMTALFAGLIVLLLLAGGTAVQRREIRRAEERANDAISEAMRKVRDEAEEHSKDSLVKLAHEGELDYDEGGVTILVVDAAGKLRWQSSHHQIAWPLDEESWRYRKLPRGSETLVVALSWEEVEDHLKDSAENLLELGALITVVTAALAWFIVGRTLSPIERLAEQARNASIESLQVRLHSPSSDSEMRNLTDTLNALLARLEREARGRAHFYAAASHELRTPIQVLLGQIDVALARTRTVTDHEELLRTMQRNTERLASLVQDLLQLNAVEMAQSQAPRERVNLRFWIEHSQSAVARMVEERDLSWDVSLQDVEAEVAVAHFDSLVRNLFENAAKYAKEGSQLKLSIETVGSGAVLKLWNACDLPADADPTTWFEPFYRPDESRNSLTGGNGLGLAICAAMARSNGWDLSLQKANGGIQATLRVPS